MPRICSLNSSSRVAHSPCLRIITIDESKPRTLTAAASGDALETVRQRVCLEMADGGKIYMDCSMEKPRTAPVRVSFEGVLDAKRMKSRVGRIVRCRPSDE